MIDPGGSDGEIYGLLDDTEKVIKLSILYENYDHDLLIRYNQIQSSLDYIMLLNPDAYVRVYEHGYLGNYSRKMVDWHHAHQNYIIYYYIMEKLNKISEDEGKIFHSILSHEDRGIEKKLDLKKIEKMLQGMQLGLDFDFQKVMFFCQEIKQSNIIHEDLHIRNIMCNSNGNFKLVDLERLKIGEYNVKE